MITYLKGDATQPHNPNNNAVIIAHVCNNRGGWGRGFVNAISKKWKLPEEIYRSRDKYPLGQIDRVVLDLDLPMAVANMIAQNGYKSQLNPQPLSYTALRECLIEVAFFSEDLFNADVHMPRIGCGLAGGKWEIVEEIIQDTLCKKGIAVYVYDF